MLTAFRHIVAVRLTTALLLPFVLVYAHGAAVVWGIYLWEWEDIVTHYCQEFSTSQCDGKAYVNAMLEKKDSRYPALPRAPQNIQEMRSVPVHLHKSRLTIPSIDLSPSSVITSPPHRGFVRGVFRPPSSVV